MARKALLGIALGAAFFGASWVLAAGQPAVEATAAVRAANGFEHMVAIAEAANAPHANYGF